MVGDTCPTMTAPPQSPDTIAVTFQVDMSLYGGTFTTPEVNGTFNGWCGNCNAMTDQGNGIWATTIDLISDSAYEFKFSHDAWAGQENFVGGEPCTITLGGFTNRELVLSGSNDITLPVVCWESCDTCGVVPDTVAVTFQVDMSMYGGSFTTPEVNGTFNGWCGNCNVMTDQGNGIWSTTIDLPSDLSYEYKFSHDNWAGQENFVGGEPCTVTNGGFTNRALNLSGSNDTTLTLVCWEACDTCGVVPDTVAVTFQVDMSLYGGTFTTPEVNGTFNGWCGNCNAMTDQGNGIWSTTIDLPSNLSYEYKFSHDAWAGQENFVGGEPCTVTNGGFTNRALNLSGPNDTTLTLVCWEILRYLWCYASIRCGSISLLQTRLHRTLQRQTTPYKVCT